MRLLIILASALAVNAGVVLRNGDGFCVNDKFLEKEVLKSDLDRPFLLAIDDETLYFNYNINEEEFKSARYNLKTGEFQDLDNIPNGFSHAIDSKNNLLYVGTNNGIYVYDITTDKAEFYGAKDQFIWTLYFKDDVLYFSEYPSQRLYTITNKTVERFKDLESTRVHYFLMDDDNDIMFFSNDTGLYMKPKQSDQAVLYKELVSQWQLRELTQDVYGNVYAALQDGIYKVKKLQKRVEKVLSINDCFGLAFDSTNSFIYADGTSIIRLNPFSNRRC